VDSEGIILVMGLNYIPKKIFTGVSTFTNLDPRISQNFSFLQELNEDWSFQVFSNQMQLEYMQENFDSEIFARFLSISPVYGAARSDLFKYCLMYLEGGVWLDAKSTANRSFSEIIGPDDKFLLSHWPGLTTGDANELFWARESVIPCPEFVTWMIISQPRHKFLEQVIERVLRNIDDYSPIKFGVAEQAVLSTTGPLTYTRAIFEIIPDLKDFRLIEAHKEGILYSIFAGMEHRKIINSKYHGRLRPLVSKNFLTDMTVIIAWSRMFYLKIMRKLKNFRYKLETP
jgi:inositol phosphorylceramide mannosyltransferase catalytic subunit